MYVCQVKMKMEEIKQCVIFNNKIILSNYNLEQQISFKEPLDEEILMNQSLDSTVEFSTIGHKQHRQSRQGDWICIRCNNLNFSFRKRCNRCKAQTRQENQQSLRQAYQYYQDYYQHLNQQTYHSQTTALSAHHEENRSSASESPSSFSLGDECLEDSFEDLTLPSVSPIIKRYNKEKSTPKTQISQGLSSDEESLDGAEYLQEYCWQNIMAEDQLDNQYSSREHIDYWDVEIEKIVKNIVI